MRALMIVTCMCLSLMGWNPAQAAEEVLPAPDQESIRETLRTLDVKIDLKPTEGRGDTSTGGGLAAKGELPASSPLFRDVPSISGQYLMGRTTLLPFIGAGFGGGYNSDRERALNPGISGLSDSGLRSHWSQFGQGFAPNEFHMGVRIPF